MDNIIDLLVVLFFIFSAFGSLFKKKTETKKPNSSASKKQKSDNYSRPSQREYSKNPFDIFNYGQNEISKEENLNVEIFEDELSKKFEHSQKSLEDLQFKKIEVERKISDSSLNNVKSNKIIQMLKNKESLKQAFVLSEILSKPKALNRSGKNLYY